MLSFAYRWLGEKTIYCESREGQKSDKQLVTKLHRLLSKTDISIAHNGDDFDNKKSNTRFIKHDLTPPNPRKSIDTLKVARKHFAFTGNSLDALAEFLGVGRKLKHAGIDMWDGCMEGSSSSWQMMRKYNKHDIFLLHGVYLKMRSWITNHPNTATNTLEPQCPKCKRYNLHRRGYKAALAVVYQQYQCQDCGGWARVTQGTRIQKPKLVSV